MSKNVVFGMVLIIIMIQYYYFTTPKFALITNDLALLLVDLFS